MRAAGTQTDRKLDVIWKVFSLSSNDIQAVWLWLGKRGVKGGKSGGWRFFKEIVEKKAAKGGETRPLSHISGGTRVHSCDHHEILKWKSVLVEFQKQGPHLILCLWATGAGGDLRVNLFHCYGGRDKSNKPLITKRVGNRAETERSYEWEGSFLTRHICMHQVTADWMARLVHIHIFMIMKKTPIKVAARILLCVQCREGTILR